ncbi:hypothetical protein AVEN_180444-1 [Araneus ventricosus]|uniref:Uncharacterized protein n=1 Tax=Araneus ventricosus TaxID=182803 RepID=A0A4Y2GIW8_ARAVE|nr:hypothetical protein AVEN_180444-1 [Araneus ventricosus]
MVYCRLIRKLMEWTCFCSALNPDILKNMVSSYRTFPALLTYVLILRVDEATFHVSTKVNISTTAEFALRKSTCSTGSGKKQSKNQCGCALLHDTVIGPFFFAEASVTANIYLDMVQSYAIPPMQHLQPTDIFQQDAGARMIEHFAGTGLPAGYHQGY